MSELKAKHVVDVYDDYSEHPCEESSQVYLKSEADKVIAKKDAEIERLEILCATYRHDCDNLAISNEQAKRAARTLLKKMNYNKYKRCLAMAEACMHKRWRPDEGFDYARSTRHMNKWLELAEKFKPNSTAQ